MHATYLKSAKLEKYVCFTFLYPVRTPPASGFCGRPPASSICISVAYKYWYNNKYKYNDKYEYNNKLFDFSGKTLAQLTTSAPVSSLKDVCFVTSSSDMVSSTAVIVVMDVVSSDMTEASDRVT